MTEKTLDQVQKEAVKALRLAVREKGAEAKDELWHTLEVFQDHPFTTVKHLEYTYYIKGYELMFSRKVKSVTRATVNLAFEQAVALGCVVDGPKKLGCFGASYLYPIFLEIGLIQKSQRSLFDTAFSRISVDEKKEGMDGSYVGL